MPLHKEKLERKTETHEKDCGRKVSTHCSFVSPSVPPLVSLHLAAHTGCGSVPDVGESGAELELGGGG